MLKPETPQFGVDCPDPVHWKISYPYSASYFAQFHLFDLLEAAYPNPGYSEGQGRNWTVLWPNGVYMELVGSSVSYAACDPGAKLWLMLNAPEGYTLLEDPHET